MGLRGGAVAHPWLTFRRLLEPPSPLGASLFELNLPGLPSAVLSHPGRSLPVSLQLQVSHLREALADGVEYDFFAREVVHAQTTREV